MDSGPRQRTGSGALDEQLAEVLSKLCDTSVAVTPSPSGANSHVHRLVASYVDGEGNPLAFAVFEIRLAAALSGAMARFAPAVAEGSVTTGVLPEPLSDALAELADVLTPFVNRSGLQPHFQQLVAYAPGEPLPSVPGRALEVKSFHGAVTRYDAGGFSIVTAKPIAE